MRIDEVINQVNQKFLFKVIAFLVLSFPTYQNYGQLQGILVAVYVPNHTCWSPLSVNNYSAAPDPCFVNINGTLQKCKKWNFSPEPVGRTLVSEFNLVCDRKSYGDTTLMVWYATSFIGIIMGWFADRYGRKKMLLFNVILETISSILLAVSPNFASSLVFRFMMGVSASSVYIAFVWLMEIVNTDFREIIGSFFWMFGCLAYMIFPGIIYGTKNWRHTQLVSLIPSVFYIFIVYVPESPRWLFVRGYPKKAFDSIRKMCIINKIKLHVEEKDVAEEKTEDPADLLLALRAPTFMIRSALTLFVQFSVYLIYLSIVVNVSILSNNVLLSMFLVGLMETPGLLLAYFTLRYLKRRHSMIIFGMSGAILIWVTTFFSKKIYWQSVIRIIIGCVAKTIIASVNQTTMVYVVELFPTSHRSFGFAFVQVANFVSFAGAIYINRLSTVYFLLPMTIYLLLMLITSLLVFCLLPETKDLPFPETLDDQAMLRIGKEDEFLEYMKKKNERDEPISVSPVPETQRGDETTPLIDRSDETL